MATFDWDWWDNLTPDDRARRERRRESTTSYEGIRSIKKRINQNGGEFFRWNKDEDD